MSDIARTANALKGLGFHNFDTSRDLGRGTAFPASADLPGGLQTSDRFFRTDLGWQCFYDGTRWLTVHEYALPTPAYPPFPQPYSGAAGNPIALVPLRNDFAWFVGVVKSYTTVATTNDASNYWTFALRTNTGTTLNTYSTQSLAPNSNINSQVAVNTVVPVSAEYLLVVVATKVGAPGALTVTMTPHVRYIAT